ncbi:XRE family transcriptional regulator [Methanocaldococcus villosus KIN24-T80]|uniref:XRE family transcriptional regulator n=1 Tax=Methanocaldococcus villosus KIN24-T80 TaxID=1069083 RepID=N6UTN3_9EURY|nr:helix-turn-helix domain-containing protein [Methanocaldococcus villosus]ENN95694.1 XRE family transcriptional regulator [Methanocaldococcus villosus KIN24-T80]
MKASERLLLKIEDSEKFVKEFKRILLELGLTLKEFAEISEIPYSTLYKIIKGKDFRVSTLVKIIKTIRQFEDKEDIDVIAVVAARPALNKITTKEIELDGKKYLIKEYPANSLEECIISAIRAEKDGVKGIICAPIVSSTIEKVVDIPVAVVIPDKNAFIEALKIITKKI